MPARRTLQVLALAAIFLVPRLSLFADSPQWVDSFVNPMDVSMADPAILKVGSTYYVYGTGFACFYSTNLVDWRVANVFGIYSHPSGDNRYNFWAPEVIQRPSDGRFVMFYTAQKPGGRLQIYVAQSNFPDRQFTPVHTDTEGQPVPLFHTHSGDAWIDASPFIDTDGQAWLYVNKDIASASNRPDRGSIFVLPLDMETLTVGAPTKVLDPNPTGWEVRPDAPGLEGAYMYKHGGQYFLFYSGNGAWTHNYAIGYAVGNSPTGPFTKYAGNPILRSGEGLYGTGHHSIGPSPDGKELFIFYHSKIESRNGWPRQLCIDRIQFLGPPGNQFVRVLGTETAPGVARASSTPQMLPSGVAPRSFATPYDPFTTLNLDNWNFMGENVWNRSVSGGTLRINAGSGDVIGTQTNISNLALAYAAPDESWQVTTRINNFAPTANGQQAFVTIWRDQQNFVRLGAIYDGGRKIRVLKEENGIPVYYDVADTLPNTKWLRIRKTGKEMRFFASSDSMTYIGLLNDGVNGYEVAWGDDPQLKLGIGALAPSASPMTMHFDFVSYDRLSHEPSKRTDRLDEFSAASLNRRTWLVHNEDQTRHGMEEEGYLRIRTQDGDWAHARRDMRNVMLQSVPSGNWTITTSVKTPDIAANYEQAFLIVARDPDNFIKYGRAYIDGRKIESGLQTDGIWSPNTIDDPWPADQFVQIRIRKSDNQYHCEASADGETWTWVGTKQADWTPLYVGIGAAAPGSGQQRDTYFDWFRVHSEPTRVGSMWAALE